MSEKTQDAVSVSYEQSYEWTGLAEAVAKAIFRTEEPETDEIDIIVKQIRENPRAVKEQLLGIADTSAASFITDGAMEFAKSETLEIDWDQFNDDQTEQIEWGLQEGLDVSWYADPAFSAEQMQEILTGIMSEVDVAIYAKPELTVEEMGNKRESLEAESFDKYYKAASLSQVSKEARDASQDLASGTKAEPSINPER